MKMFTARTHCKYLTQILELYERNEMLARVSERLHSTIRTSGVSVLILAGQPSLDYSDVS